MTKDDSAFKELLELLKRHPALMKDLVFDPTHIQGLLNSEEARKLALGEEATAFLRYVSSGDDGYGIAQCFKGTGVLAAKGTKMLVCGGGTKSDHL